MTKFEELLQQINRQHVYIQTHNFPDPDAIASAYGLKRLLATRGIEASICYKGKIDRYGTGRLCEILDIELLNVEDLTEVLTDEDEVILVDSQKGNSNIINITGDEIICIDHHPYNDKCQYRFQDIRPEVGACATMIAQYFMENDIAMDKKIATALTYGIRIDTHNLSRGVSKLDIEMLYRMYDDCDYEEIHTLENSNLCFDSSGSLPDQSDATILTAKLTAMLRLANSMDRSHGQKLKDCRITVKDKTLTVSAEYSGDITLEAVSFEQKAAFFEEIFGIRPVLKQKRRV